MYDIAIKIDRAHARMGKLPDEVRAALKSEADTLATKLREKSKDKFEEFFHARSGAFLKSIKKSVRSTQKTVTGKIYSKSPVARWLERGVKPHDIRPKNAKALAFLGGQFAEVVHHPGFAGHTIINAAFQEMRGEIKAGMTQAVRDGIKSTETANSAA